jgi:hypothetical protein
LAHGLRITPAFLESRRADLNPARRMFFRLASARLAQVEI